MNSDINLFKIHNTLDPEPGRILFSEPFTKDAFFGRSVVLLAENNSDGTVGFILNKPSKLYLGRFLDSFIPYKIPVFFGGPVGADTMHFIHNVGEKIPNTLKIAENLYWGGEIKEIPLMLEKNLVKPENFKFFLGYSGWDAGQLLTEIQNNFWAITTIPAEDIFSQKTKELWKNTVQQSGEEYKFWLNVPKESIMN